MPALYFRLKTAEDAELKGMTLWYWLSANSEALGSLVAAVGLLLSAVTIWVLFVTWRSIRAQAEAARALTVVAKEQADAAKKQTEVAEQQRVASERVALAAEKQVEAAIGSSAVAEAQRKATEEAARAERVYSELTRHQILAQLRPVLVFGSKPHPTMGASTITFVENHGEGIALNIKLQLDRPNSHPMERMKEIYVGLNLLGPNKSAEFSYDYRNTNEGMMYARYDSLDGRFFVTKAVVQSQSFGKQESFQLNANGGWTPEPPVPAIDPPNETV